MRVNEVLPRLFGKNQKVLFWQEIKLSLQYESGFTHLSFNHFAGGVMAAKEWQPVCAAEFDDGDATALPKVLAYFSEIDRTVFQVVVGVGGENNVDAGLR